MKPSLHDSVKISLYVPRHVDRVWRAVGYDEIDYEYNLLESIRSLFDAVMSGTSVGQGAILLLEQETKHLREP